ncbi:hypothetical protein V6768_02385 [Tistrella mobilis]
MPFSDELITEAVARYRRERDRYVKLADRVAEICREDVCEQNAIRAHVTFRIKTEKSFEGKLRRFASREDRNYTSIDEIFASISDLAGVRVSAYQEKDCNQIVQKMEELFCGPAGQQKIEIDRKDKKTDLNENYYRATHVQAALRQDQLIGIYDNVGDISCEIQICTMIAHVWNEVEHDIGYKSDDAGPSPDEAYHLNDLGRLVRRGDHVISALMAAHERRLTAINPASNSVDPERPFMDVHDFVSRMRDFWGDAMPKFAENSGQLFDLLNDLGVNSPKAVQDTLQGMNAECARALLSRLNDRLAEEGVTELSLKPETSDLMLVPLANKMPDQIRAALQGRAGRGRGRPTRLHRVMLRHLSQA